MAERPGVLRSVTMMNKYMYLDSAVAVSVMGWPSGSPRDSRDGVTYFTAGLKSWWLDDYGPISVRWSPTADASADYDVLRKVRETWAADNDNRFEVFCESLKTIWWPRSTVTMHFLLATLYEPGDYSLAALMTLGIQIDEPAGDAGVSGTTTSNH